MRLQAKLTPMRAERRDAGLRATLRDAPENPHDIEIIDISDTGFLAELPERLSIEPGTSVRVAASPIGRHTAFVVRSEGRRHGFAFERPLPRGTLERMESVDPDTVVAFAGAEMAPIAVARPLPSARVSISLMAGVAILLWGLLGSLLIVTARLM